MYSMMLKSLDQVMNWLVMTLKLCQKNSFQILTRGEKAFFIVAVWAMREREGPTQNEPTGLTAGLLKIFKKSNM